MDRVESKWSRIRKDRGPRHQSWVSRNRMITCWLVAPRRTWSYRTRRTRFMTQKDLLANCTKIQPWLRIRSYGHSRSSRRLGRAAPCSRSKPKRREFRHCTRKRFLERCWPSWRKVRLTKSVKMWPNVLWQSLRTSMISKDVRLRRLAPWHNSIASIFSTSRPPLQSLAVLDSRTKISHLKDASSYLTSVAVPLMLPSWMSNQIASPPWQLAVTAVSVDKISTTRLLDTF